MLKFFITIEERNQAQARAAALDIGRSNPPGQHPYVWDNRMGCVNRWYNYASPENKIGTIYFEPASKAGGQPSEMVECSTKISHHPPLSPGQPRQARIADPEDHEQLVGFFFRELLGKAAKTEERSGS